MNATPMERMDRGLIDDSERRAIQKRQDDFWIDGGNFADFLALQLRRREVADATNESRQLDLRFLQVGVVAFLLLSVVLIAAFVS